MYDNEYREKASALLKDIIHVETADYPRAQGYNITMCMVNGIKYVQAKQISHNFTERKEKLISSGILRPSAFFNFIADNGQPRTFVMLSSLIEAHDDIRDFLSKTDKGDAELFDATLDAAKNAMNIPQTICSQKDFDLSHNAYHERLRMLREAKAYDEVKKAEILEQAERKREQERYDKEQEEGRTLRSLVEQIEAMGWQVTLTLKNYG